MRRRWMLKTRPALGVGLAFMLLVTALPGPVFAQTATSDALHQVKPGESLWTIAKLRFGRGALWPRLYHANRQVIGSNPSMIRPGMRLRLDVARSASVGPALTSIAKPRPVPAPPVLPSAAPAEAPLKPEAVRPLPVATKVEPPLAEARPDDRPTTSADLGSASRSLDLSYLPVASSLIVPGSGQAMQGRWEQGLSHLGLMAVSLMAFKAGSEQGDRSLQVLGGLGLVGITLWSPWDTFQGLTKPKDPDESR
ncbi:LysM domain/BON superfamily protein [compost metagenome]